MQKSLLGSSLIVVGAFIACGGHTSDSSPTSGAQNDAGVTTNDGGSAPSDASSDAPVVSDADPPDYPADVYPAPHHPLPVLKNAGGLSTVMQHPKVVTVTYVGEASRDAIRTFDDQIVQGAWWSAVTEGFGINAGTSGGYVELADDVSGMTLDNDADLVPYLLDHIAAGKIPAPDADTLYALYFPQATTITLTQGGLVQTSCRDFGAYHESAGFPVNGQTITASFAVIPNCGMRADGTDPRWDSASHELIEAATDPTPGQGWYANGYYAWFGASLQGGGEAADMCEFGPAARDESGNLVARSWVNAAAMASRNPCQPSPAGQLYFNAAIETTESYLEGSNGLSEGFVSVKVGASTSVGVTVFSEAALPHDLTLDVGKRPRRTGGGVGDAGVTLTALSPIAQGVTATLSRTTGHNGSRITLNLSAAANAPKGEHPFVVRAILENDNTQTWPAILRVL